MLWELDVFEVLGLCHPGDAAHQHLVDAAKQSMLLRIMDNTDAFPRPVLTMLQVRCSRLCLPPQWGCQRMQPCKLACCWLSCCSSAQVM